ncbi:MAG: protein translocase subunit SecF [Nitrospinae bacterium]|nr:protein translocase subunit SecF [Nitrospinota bacterium]
MEFFKQRTTIDFMGRARLALIFSGALILIGILSVVFRGGLKYGIDFAGGTLVQLKFKEPPSLDHVRDGLKNLGLGDSAIQEFGSRSEILIRVQKSEEKLEDVGSRIKNGLEQALGVKDIVVDRVEIVGPKVGKDLRMKALLSIFYSLIGILVYIAWRFELRYAVGAIIATVHDVIITLGAFSLLNMEFDLVVVAGFLTLIGYSLNDTIVVYDRVRENARRESKTSLFDVINASVNQTLSRTILTSGCTLLVVIALYFFGGEIIHGFAFSLLVGIFVGTYSSIFIASVCVLFWENKSLSFKRA